MCVSYLSRAINRHDRKNAINDAIDSLKKLGWNPDFIATMGVSGNTFGSILSYLLDIQICIVR